MLYPGRLQRSAFNLCQPLAHAQTLHSQPTTLKQLAGLSRNTTPPSAVAAPASALQGNCLCIRRLSHCCAAPLLVTFLACCQHHMISSRRSTGCIASVRRWLQPGLAHCCRGVL